MQPKQLEGFNYTPITVASYQDPWADVKMAMQRQASLSKKPSSKRGSKNQSWLSSIISELSGAGGAAAGATAGAAIGAPLGGVGAIPGAIIGGIVGGFGGGTAGRLVENKVRDDEYRLGDALKEGALSGAFGAVGPAWQGARGLGALGKATGGKGIASGIQALGGLSDDTAKVAGKAIAKGGAKAGRAIGQGVTSVDDLAYASQRGLQSTGSKLRTYQRGTVAGNAGMSAKDATSYNRALDGVNKWFSGIGKSAQYTNADDAINALSKQYANSPEATKVFGKANADDLADRFLANIDDNPVLRETLKGKNSKVVLNLLDDALSFKGKKNADFIKFVSGKINPRYRTISSGGSAGSVESQVLEAFREASKSLIDERLVTRSGVNKQISSLMGASKQLGRAITRDAGAGAGQGLTLGRIAGDIAGPSLDVVGRGMQQVGKVTKYTTPVVKGALARGLLNGGSPPESAGSEDEQLMQAYEQFSGAQGGDPFAEAMVGGQELGGMGDMEQSPYSLQQALADIQRDPRNAEDYMQYYKFFSEATAGPKLTAQEKKAQQQSKTALQGLTQLKSLFSEAGGGQNRLPGIFGNIQGRLGSNSKADSYNKIRNSLTTTLARAFGETGVLTDQDREVYLQALPRLEDTPEEAQIKIQYLEDMLAGGGYSQEPDLSSILQQYQGRYQ